ncbi:MAG: hypothetical protein NTY41_01145 [Proteobacteria bacterium]|nr:hypothetical protein [Pseudomonadota bacterium]
MPTKSSGNTTARTIYRDSETGKITTQRYAEKHPATTEKERVRVPPPAPSKKK